MFCFQVWDLGGNCGKKNIKKRKKITLERDDWKRFLLIHPFNFPFCIALSRTKDNQRSLGLLLLRK